MQIWFSDFEESSWGRRLLISSSPNQNQSPLLFRTVGYPDNQLCPPLQSQLLLLLGVKESSCWPTQDRGGPRGWTVLSVPVTDISLTLAPSPLQRPPRVFRFWASKPCDAAAISLLLASSHCPSPELTFQGSGT